MFIRMMFTIRASLTPFMDMTSLDALSPTCRYRNGSYKLIMPGGINPSADGWSAQYPGTSPVVKPNEVPNAAQCKPGPCLFDLATDPNEHVNLAPSHPALLSSMHARYMALATRAAALGDGTLHAWSNGERQGLRHHGDPNGSNCTLNGTWVIGTNGGTVTFVLGPDQRTVSMRVDTCPKCAFTHGVGTQDPATRTVTLVASGKGIWIQEHGDVSVDGCTITWVSHNTTGVGTWPPFTQQGHAPAPPPPGPSTAQCDKMRETGHYAPWM